MLGFLRFPRFRVSLSSIIMWFIVLGCQTTDVTIGPFKIWEVLTLIMSVFLLKYVNRKIFYLFLLFFLLFISSLIISYFSADYFDSFGGLKSKYYISIARFVELVLCCIVVSIVYGYYRKQIFSFGFIINSFLTKNALFCIVIAFFYLVDFFVKTNFVSYGDSNRLRGFYVEGGPFGLYLASLFFLSLFFSKNKKISYLFFLMFVFCQSKAGYVLLALSVFLFFVLKVKQLKSFVNPKNKIRLFCFVLSCLLIVFNVIFIFANNYINDASEVETIVKQRPNDNNIVMGRIAGGFIGIEMIKANPLLGVGLGNYSLVRNNEYYRHFFPHVNDWDLTGLGGIYNLLVENGILGILLFVLWFIYFFKFDHVGILFSVVFIFPFLLGAQLYMVYPWVYCSFYLLWCKNEDSFR